MSNNIPIVFSTDNNYVMPTGVAILSLLESAQSTTIYDIFVLINDDVTEEGKNLLRKQVACFPNHTINFIYVGNIFENSFEIRNISTATYSRLLIPWLLPQYDKIIYSDVDVIFRIDLADAYNIDMKDNFFAGVPSILFFTIHSYKKYIINLGLTPGKYIIAGFLVINSKLQRELDLKNRFLEEAKKKYIYQDQDIINLVCKERIAHLSQAYSITPIFYKMLFSENLQFHHFYENSEIPPKTQGLANAIDFYKRRENCILHYAGKKPWEAFTQAWREWWNTYQRSVFYNPDREISISRQVLQPTPTWRLIASQIKRKLFS